MRKRSRLVISAFAGVVLCCSPAHADAGLPMLALTWPIAIDALIPVILIEAYVFKCHGFPFLWSLKWNAIANVASTLIGIPLTWGILFVLELAFGYSGLPWPGIDTLAGKVLTLIVETPWLAPWGNAWPVWIVPTAFLILLVAYFFVSWRVETMIIRSFNRDRDRKAISRACLRANLITYALLALFPVSLFFQARWPDWVFWFGRLIW
jgi:hypothetical protein